MKKLLTIIILMTSCIFAGPKDFTWNGGGTDNNWTTAGNWDTSPFKDGKENSLYFAGDIRLAPNNLASWKSWHGIYFNSGAGAFTITGDPIKLYNGIIENNSSIPQTVSLSSIALYDGNAEFNPVAGDLTLNGSTRISIFDHHLIILGNNGHTITFDIPIESSASGGVSINENSFVVYKKNNTYVAPTYVNAGKLHFDEGSAVGGGTIYVGDDTIGATAPASLYISDPNGGTTVDEPIEVRAGSSGQKTIGGLNGSGINTYSGTVTVNAPAFLQTTIGGTIAFSGVISGSGTINQIGTGTLSIDNSGNTFTGVVTIQLGTLAGIGKVSGDTIIQSTVSPGASVGTLTFGSALQFHSGSKYEWDISGDLTDTIIVDSLLLLPSADSIEVIVNRSSAVNGTYTLISSAGINTGDETAFWSMDDQVEFQINGNDVEIVVTPEPGVLMGLVLGLITLRAKGLTQHTPGASRV